MPSKDFFENKRLQLIVISVFIFLMYARTISYEYIGLDDTTLIETNYKFIKNLNNLPEAFKHHVMYVNKNFDKEKDYYRPYAFFYAGRKHCRKHQTKVVSFCEPALSFNGLSAFICLIKQTEDKFHRCFFTYPIVCCSSCS